MKYSFNHLPSYVASPRVRFVALAVFLTLAFSLGGGSRTDIQSLVLLQPLAFLFLAFGLTQCSKKEYRALGMPIYLLMALGGLMILQLIPLPGFIWTNLPFRDVIVETEQLAGMSQPWRPISISPSRTWSSLISLAIPATAMFLFAIQDRQHRAYIMPFFMGLALLSALLAIIQLSGAPGNPFYLYRVTNEGGAVGLFANRNHQAVFLACAILMHCWYFSQINPKDPAANLKTLFAIGGLIILIPLIFVTGSRAGLLMGGISLVIGVFFILQSHVFDKLKIFGQSRAVSTTILSSGLFIGIGAMILAPILLSRSAAFDRLFVGDSVDGMRQALLPTLIKMSQEFFIWGSGFGTFETIYKAYEPVEMLNTKYLNMAHNDWLQWVIESGFVGVILLLIFLGWFFYRSFAIVRFQNLRPHGQRILAVVLIVIWGVASLFDYPLRVPSLMVFFAILCAVLARPGYSK